MPAPTITALTPSQGPAGTSVAITGTNLAGASTVRFNGVGAAYVVDSPTKITATVPAALTGSGRVSVTTGGGSGISPASFVLRIPPATVAALESRLQQLAVDHADICTHHTYTDSTGAPVTTAEGRGLHYAKVGKGGGLVRPPVLVVAGIHAREWAPPEAVLSFVEKLLVAYRDQKDITYGRVTHFSGTYGPFRIYKEEVRRIVERLDLYVAPLVNPDGRAFSLSTASTTTTAVLLAVGTTLHVASAAGFPTVGRYDVLIGTERLRVTGGQGTTTWTVERAAAVPHPSGTAVVLQGDMWRKNRRVIGECVGVDINRNFDVAWKYETYYDMTKVLGPTWLWDYDDYVASGRPMPRTKGIVLSSKDAVACDDALYRGPSAASEVETRFVQDLVAAKEIRYFLDVHSYSRSVMYPWSLEEDQATRPTENLRNLAFNGKREGVGGTYGEYFPNEPPDKLLDSHRLLAQKMADEIEWPSRGQPLGRLRSEYRPHPGIQLYTGGHPPDPVPGASDDWVFSRQITAAGYDAAHGPTHAFTVECGSDEPEEGGFHPHYTGAVPKIEREVHLALRAFLRHAANSSACMIATAAHGTPLHADVAFLRHVRDGELQATLRGRRVVSRLEHVYYGFSPAIARFLRAHRLARDVTRLALTPGVRLLRAWHALLRPVPWPGVRRGLLAGGIGVLALLYPAVLAGTAAALVAAVGRLLGA